MTTPRCKAGMKDGAAWHECVLHTDGHASQSHRDATGFEWPTCSQHCLIDHAHGKYRRKMGPSVGPVTMAARTPKPTRTGKRGGRKRCKVCMQVTELGKDGRCVDQEACAAVAVPLF